MILSSKLTVQPICVCKDLCKYLTFLGREGWGKETRVLGCVCLNPGEQRRGQARRKLPTDFGDQWWEVLEFHSLSSPLTHGVYLDLRGSDVSPRFFTNPQEVSRMCKGENLIFPGAVGSWEGTGVWLPGSSKIERFLQALHGNAKVSFWGCSVSQLPKKT